MVEIALVPMELNESNLEFAYAMKRDALGPHIIPTWGWNESLQRATLTEKMKLGSYFRILADGTAVGTVAIVEAFDHLRIDDFYVSPHRQNQGIGSSVIARILENADAKCLPVRVDTQRWNPAVSLYKRHGFTVINETETHLSMQRALPNK